MTSTQTKAFPIAMTGLFVLVSAFSISGLHASPQSGVEPIACSQADQPSDYAICNSEKLLLLDEELSATARQHFSSLQSETQRDEFRDEQSRWVDERGACGNNAECIEAHYRARLGEIRQMESASITSFKRFALQEGASLERID